METLTKSKTPLLYLIASKFEKRITAALLAAFDFIRDQNSLDELEDALNTGGITGVLQKISTMEKIIGASLLRELSEAVFEGGRMLPDVLPKKALAPTWFFNTLDPNTVNELKRHHAYLVAEITTTTRDAIVNNLQAGIIAGNNPRKIARDLKEIIGLSSIQDQAVRNFRTGLIQGDISSVKKLIREGKVDSSLLDLLLESKKIPKKKVDAMVKDFRNRMISSRARTIARTEAMRAVSMGEYCGLIQAKAEGSLTVDVLRFWVSAKDERTRYSHREIPKINSQGVPIEGSFKTPRGYLLRFPRDPAAPASEVVNCRCRIIYKIIE